MGELIVLFVLIDVLSCRIHWLGGLIVCVDGLLVGLMDSLILRVHCFAGCNGLILCMMVCTECYTVS